MAADKGQPSSFRSACQPAVRVERCASVPWSVVKVTRCMPSTSLRRLRQASWVRFSAAGIIGRASH